MHGAARNDRKVESALVWVVEVHRRDVVLSIDSYVDADDAS